MKKILIHNLSKPQAQPIQAGFAVSFRSRLRGLTFRRNMPEGEGLLLVERKDSRVDTAIHMLFVFMDLGVIWINNDCQVVDAILAKSWHLAYVPKVPARYVLEVNPQCLDEFTIGDRLSFAGETDR